MKRQITLSLLLIFSFLTSPRAVQSVGYDLTQFDFVASQFCLNEEGKRWVHDRLNDIKGADGLASVEDITLMCEEARTMKSMLKGGGKCARAARNIARAAKRFGPAGFVVTVFFIGSDVRAEGLCKGVCKNVPGIDVVIEGNETLDSVFKEINDWRLDDLNAQNTLSHIAAGALTRSIMGKPQGDLDGNKVMECISTLYDKLQLTIYVRIANQPANQIDWTFLQAGHPVSQQFINPIVFEYNSCIASAVNPPPVCLPQFINPPLLCEPEGGKCCQEQCPFSCPNDNDTGSCPVPNPNCPTSSTTTTSPSPTVVPTTRPPTTQPPITISPTTRPPTTRPPTTRPPTTRPPTTRPPTTRPPTTQPPTTRPPTTQPPTTQPPTTRPPTTQPPITISPTTRPPTTQPPTTRPVITITPTTQPPTTRPVITIPPTTRPVITIPPSTQPPTTRPVITITPTTQPPTTWPPITISPTSIPWESSSSTIPWEPSSTIPWESSSTTFPWWEMSR